MTYGDVAARELPDVLIEDDCRSIGADQLTHPQRYEVSVDMSTCTLPEGE